MDMEELTWGPLCLNESKCHSGDDPYVARIKSVGQQKRWPKRLIGAQDILARGLEMLRREIREQEEEQAALVEA